jgi:uncharacterized membrane protein YphA (DoxX/SURF4 family)
VPLIQAGAAVVSGVFVLIGLWTPFAASLGALLEMWIVFSRAGFQGTPLLLAGLAVSLVMLGPGAWSIDARLFGRRRIDFPER